MPTVDLSVDAGDDLAIDGTNDLAIGPGSAAGGAVAMPLAWTATQRLFGFSDDKVPPMGGRAQRLTRLGARYGVTFTSLPSLDGVNGPALLAIRTRARANAGIVTLSWPQPAFQAAIGAPAVNGAGQAGMGLVCNGFTPGAEIPPLSFFSMTIGARSYLHCNLVDAIADGGGNATLTIGPMLRASPAAGAALNFANPQIQGFVQGGVETWALERLAWLSLQGFTVVEAA